jgi:hypothetical protein
MFTQPVLDKLKAIGHDIRKVLPDLTGQVTFNVSSDHPEPKVTIVACDVTKETK